MEAERSCQESQTSISLSFISSFGKLDHYSKIMVAWGQAPHVVWAHLHSHPPRVLETQNQLGSEGSSLS